MNKWELFVRTVGKAVSARFLCVIAVLVVFVRLGWVVGTLITTPEQAKEVLLIISPIMTAVVVFYFTRNDRSATDTNPPLKEIKP